MSTFRHAPAPLFAPRRDLTYCTEGSEIALIARLMGRDLMPWQRLVVDVATEYKVVDGQRRYKYSTVLVTVPRQSGKTTLVGPVQVHRVVSRPGIAAFFTAQTGVAAGRRIRDLISAVNESPLAAVLTPRYTNGAEGFTCLGNRSSLQRFAPTEDAIHGETPALVTIDEIWRFSADKGNALIGGISPAQITLHGAAQLWMISTKGTLASGFMNEYVKTGRAGSDPALAYFEWACPDGLDPWEPASWWQYHPALGNTITEAALLAEREKLRNNPGEWVRAYGNRLTTAENPIVDPDAWASLAGGDMIPPSDLAAVAVTYDVGTDDTLSAVLATWRDVSGRACSRVLHQAPGSTWVAGYVTERRESWGCTVAADGAGPAKPVTDKLREAGVEVVTLTRDQRGSADVAWLTAARSGNLRHDGSDVLAAAVAAAVLRTTDGVTKISRDHSPRPVAALIASAVGLWAHDYAPRPAGLQIW